MIKITDIFSILGFPYKQGYFSIYNYDSISRQLAKYTLNAWKDDAKYNEPTGRVEFEVGPGKDLEYGDLEFLYKGVAVFSGIQTYAHNGYAKLKSGEIAFTPQMEQLEKQLEDH